MRKHKHYAIFHKARPEHRLEREPIGRRAHGLASGVRPLTPKQMQAMQKREGIYLNSSPAHSNAVAAELERSKRRKA